MLEWRLKAYRHWLTMSRAGLGERPLPADRLPGHRLLLRAEAEEGARVAGRGRPGAAGDAFEKLGIPLDEQKRLAGVAVDAVFDSVSVAHDLQGEARRAGRHLLLVLRGGARAPGAGARSTSARSCPYTDNFFATLNSRGLHRRLVRLRAQGRALPDGALHLLPHQRRRHRPVRADADRRRRGRARSSYLEGCTAPMRDENQLHAAVVELVALDDAQIKYSTVQNWYPGDAEGRGGIYNFVTKRGKCAGARRRFAGPRSRPARPSPGSTRAASSRATTRSASSTRSRSPTPAAGRHRHEDDPHRPEHPLDHHLQGHLRRPRPEHLPRAREGAEGRRRARATHTQCDSLLIGDRCGAHTFPYIEVRNPTATGRARGVDLEDQRGPALLLPAARASRDEDAVSMIVNGFCREVLQELPMEFAVEAQKLLGSEPRRERRMSCRGRRRSEPRFTGSPPGGDPAGTPRSSASRG